MVTTGIFIEVHGSKLQSGKHNERVVNLNSDIMLTCTSFQGMRKEHTWGKVNDYTVKSFQRGGLVIRGESSKVFEKGSIGEK